VTKKKIEQHDMDTKRLRKAWFAVGAKSISLISFDFGDTRGSMVQFGYNISLRYISIRRFNMRKIIVVFA
jgi:hypothetical protein